MYVFLKSEVMYWFLVPKLAGAEGQPTFTGIFRAICFVFKFCMSRIFCNLMQQRDTKQTEMGSVVSRTQQLEFIYHYFFVSILSLKMTIFKSVCKLTCTPLVAERCLCRHSRPGRRRGSGAGTRGLSPPSAPCRRSAAPQPPAGSAPAVDQRGDKNSNDKYCLKFNCLYLKRRIWSRPERSAPARKTWLSALQHCLPHLASCMDPQPATMWGIPGPTCKLIIKFQSDYINMTL